MTNVVVVGSQWGDEGKGKIVDWLSERADVVVRFQGGHNAGHTLVVDGEVYKLSLMPSGIVRPGKLSVIGSGVVVDPWALVDEIARLQAQGVEISPDNLVIAENAVLILPFHGELDGIREDRKSSVHIGTTRRGIGPAYEDKVGRRAMRLCDLADPDTVQRKLDDLIAYHNVLRAAADFPPIDREAVMEKIEQVKEGLLSYGDVVWRRLEDARRQGKRILFEGAQGTMLDVDHGTYPFVTSSNTVAGVAASGSGMGPTTLGYVLGITKAYTTRVGAGPFPTELEDEIGRGLGERGKEFGTVTGRARRCGWFDAVMVRQAMKVSGVSGIALTKLDVLDGMESLKVCIGYKLNGAEIQHFPAGMANQAQVEPIYETVEGWSESTQGAQKWADLPATAIKYIRRLEELIETPVALLSTSPEREDTVLVHDPYDG